MNFTCCKTHASARPQNPFAFPRPAQERSARCMFYIRINYVFDAAAESCCFYISYDQNATIKTTL